MFPRINTHKQPAEVENRKKKAKFETGRKATNMKRTLCMVLLLMMLSVMPLTHATTFKTNEQAINGYEAILAFVNCAADFGVKLGEYDFFSVSNIDAVSSINYANAIFWISDNNKVFYASYHTDSSDPNDIYLLLAFVHAFDSTPSFDSVSATMGQDPNLTWLETYAKVMKATKEKPYMVGTYDEYSAYFDKADNAVCILYTGK